VKNLRLAGQDGTWPGLEWLSGLMQLGSVAGAAAWRAYMQTAALAYEPHATRQRGISQDAAVDRGGGADAAAAGVY